MNIRQHIGIVTSLFILLAAFSAHSSATEEIAPGVELEENTLYTELKAGNNLKLRGWEIADKIYFGQAKIAGEYGLGLVVQNKSFTFGLNNRGIALLKSF